MGSDDDDEAQALTLSLSLSLHSLAVSAGVSQRTEEKGSLVNKSENFKRRGVLRLPATWENLYFCKQGC